MLHKYAFPRTPDVALLPGLLLYNKVLPLMTLSAIELEKMITFRRELHQHPELSGQESITAERIAMMLRGLGVDEVHEKIGGHGVVGVIKGASPGATVGLRADFDALPLEEANQFSHRSSQSNVMHACGHDGHTAMLMAAAAQLVNQRPAQGSVVLIFGSSSLHVDLA